MRINKLAAAALLPVIAIGTMVGLSGTASAHPGHPAQRAAIVPSGVVTATPSTNLKQGEKVQIAASMMGDDTTTLYAAICDPRIASDPNQSPTWCDLTPSHDFQSTAPVVAGAGTIANFVINIGANFKATHKGAECDFNSPAHQCYLVVTNAPATGPGSPPTIAGFEAITFKDTRAASKTTVKTKKSAKAGSKLTFKVATKGTGGKPTGNVVIKDNGKKIASGKEKAGKVTLKGKITKKGKNKITASYAGDANFKPSVGKATVTGK